VLEWKWAIAVAVLEAVGIAAAPADPGCPPVRVGNPMRSGDVICGSSASHRTCMSDSTRVLSHRTSRPIRHISWVLARDLPALTGTTHRPYPIAPMFSAAAADASLT
jgi:hypothetical protein